MSAESTHSQNKEESTSRASQGMLPKKRGRPWKVPGERTEDRPFASVFYAVLKLS